MNDEISTQSLLSAGFDHCRGLWNQRVLLFRPQPHNPCKPDGDGRTGDDHFSLREPHTAAGTGDCVGKATRNQELQGATNHPKGQGNVLLLHWIQ